MSQVYTVKVRVIDRFNFMPLEEGEIEDLEFERQRKPIRMSIELVGNYYKIWRFKLIMSEAIRV